MDDIPKWRKKIDELDLELVKLLNQRSQCAIEIGKLKHKLDIEIYDPRREEEVIGRVWKEANGPLSKEAVKRLFERIIDESRRAERESRGPEGPGQDRGPLEDREGVTNHGYRHGNNMLQTVRSKGWSKNWSLRDLTCIAPRVWSAPFWGQ